MALENVAQQYFKNLNSIANRIHCDLENTKSAHEYLWEKLSHEEQLQVLNETIIKPEILIKYQLGSKLRKEVTDDADDLTIIADDNNSLFRDGHGGPSFNVRTKSQKNLCTIVQQEEQNKVRKVNKNIVVANGNKIDKSEQYVGDNNDEDNYPIPIEFDALYKYIDKKPNEANLPKTGCDLLDNW